jgi:predicted DNA-binding transcriptional regulator YafY
MPVEEKVKTYRILKLDAAIRSGKYPNAVSLAEELEINPRTIQRDIEFLRDMYDAPIEYDYTKKGYYYSEPNFFIKSIMLTEGELFSVALFDRLLDEYKTTPLEGDLRNIFKKIAESLPDNISVDTVALPEKTTFIPDNPIKIENQVFKNMFTALKMRVAVQAEYRKRSSTEYDKRTLEPYHALVHRGYWYIVAHCPERETTHVYMLQRFRNVKLTKKAFVIPPSFNIAEYYDKSVGVYVQDGKTYDFEFEIDKTIGTFAVERFYHENQEIIQDADGTVHVKFSTSQIIEVMRWVMGRGYKIKVIKPPELIKMILDETQRIAALYNLPKQK